ncbi:hypothetical protein GNF10_25195 [Nostoc sp. UCD121]|uniref:hypothetical protein n=1 Tax=unclassified Nostoc TaxID=2593658 RepID=UPI0016268D38|nr:MULTISPECIES: hypothetical protein [unclassified Nostoc]MBC1218620.1 hypothetical protein [Nostoc sp. UCD120]MBC1279168.1 hypothetical protein [Nostoc sp. UCD121]MBC1294931.1 hypothetical protein [Nostoc sp. UCD122]
MAITIKPTLLNNQSILENIALVEEIHEQAAEIISGGQSGNLFNKEISAFEGDDIEIDPNEVEDDKPKTSGGILQQANFAFG